MSPEVIGGIGFLILFILMVLGIPLGVTMGLIGFAGLWAVLSFGAAFAKMAQAPFDFIANYSFAALPLFFLMGQVIVSSGQGDTIFKVARKWFGRLPGGLAIATVVACAIFGTVSGSSIATAVTIGLVAIPQMLSYKYDPGFASGSTAAGGTLGSLIPPSTFMMVYGIITENSISKLFVGGILPGIICTAAYSLVIMIRCHYNPDLGPAGVKTTLREKISSVKDIWEIIVLGILCMGGMMIGLFTATEAGAIGAAGAFLLSGIKGRLSRKVFKDILRESMKTLGMTYALLIGAYLFNYFCTVTRLPDALSKMVLGLQLPALGIMAAIVIIYLILGALMDEMSIQLLTTPIIYPIVTHGLGFDPIWFGVMQARLLQIGQIAPPVGIIVFVLRGLFKEIPMATMYRGVLWFLAADMVILVMFVLWPNIILYLPNMMK
jgi:C4-dicarboxylate transporter DctM subunit